MERLGLSAEDLSCPICMERLRDPFVTPCGHSFCYSCITTHLNMKSNCPCCSEYLIPDRVYPNYLLSKVVSKASEVEPYGGRAPIVQQLQAVLADDSQSLQMHDVDLLLQLLLEKKQEMQQYETEANLELLLHFLTHSRESKAKKLQVLQDELCILDKDIHQVETRQGHLPAAASMLALPAAQHHIRSKLNSPSPSAGQLLLQDADARSAAVAGTSRRRWQPDRLEVSREPAVAPAARTLHPGHLVSSGLFQPNGHHVSVGALGLKHLRSNLSPRGPAVVLEHAPSGQVEALSSLPATSSSPVASSEISHLPTSSASEPIQPLRQGSCPPEFTQRALPFAEHPDAMRVFDGYEGRGLAQGVPLAGRFSPDVSAGAAASSGTGTSGAHANGTTEGGNTTDRTETETSLARSGSAPGPLSQGRKRQRFESQFEDLQQCYLRLRCQQERSTDGSLANSSPLDGPQASKRVRQVEDTATNGGSETVGSARLLPSGQAPPAAVARAGPEGIATMEAAGPLAEMQALGASDPRVGSLASTQGGLQEFSRMLSMFTQCSKLKVIAQLPGASQRASAAILSSIEFDRDARLFATAGVSKRISIFNYQSVVTNCSSNNGMQVAQTPAAELLSRSKLSCLAWNRYIEPHLISSDYEGVITLWDAEAGQPVVEYEAHEKRIWSVDFCHTEPSLLVSGSDDGFVKVWSTNQASSVAQVDMKANVCCVKYSPASSYEMAIGSADHSVHLYDLRNFQRPVYVFSGHRKAVSYVRYMSAKEVVSASTDSTLRLWNTQSFEPVRTYSGHVNEKNFVGLSIDCEFIACGSESSEVFVYYRSMAKPIAKRVFKPPASQQTAAGAHSRANMQFISALCWKPMSQTLLAANSQGTINVMQLTS